MASSTRAFGGAPLRVSATAGACDRTAQDYPIALEDHPCLSRRHSLDGAPQVRDDHFAPIFERDGRHEPARAELDR